MPSLPPLPLFCCNLTQRRIWIGKFEFGNHGFILGSEEKNAIALVVHVCARARALTVPLVTEQMPRVKTCSYLLSNLLLPL